MRTLVQNTQQHTSDKSEVPGPAHFGLSRGVSSSLHLQRTFGNQAGQPKSHGPAHDFSRIPVRVDAPVKLRAKLRVNSPGDALEQEADQVAEQVMRLPDTQVLRRKCTCDEGHACDECGQTAPLVQRQATSDVAGTDAPQIVNEVLRSPGLPLDHATRSFMEPRFGHDFSRVRVHTDARAAASARAVNALAYTVGQDLVFNQGQYRPGTTEGKRLLAHELTHVAQGFDGRLRRKAATAADVPKFEFEPAVNQPPCACVVFMHNDERKARRTARLLHTNCRYNLAMVQDTEAGAVPDRKIKIPRHGETDPNSLFPADVVNACMDDEKACRDFTNDKQSSKKPDEILGFAQRKYFLAIKDCSQGFQLPVVALHNNVLSDTANYRAKMGRKGVEDLKLDVDKRSKATGSDVLDTIRKLIKEKFDETGVKQTLGTDQMTNIYRWCQSDDLERCHIGNPEHPDNVVWVTNPNDFDKLKTTKTNVVFESQKPKPATSESAGDLSTMFVLLALRLADRWSKQAGIVQGILDERVQNAVRDTLGPLLLLDPRLEDAEAEKKKTEALIDSFKAMSQAANEVEHLRYVNIETEGKSWGAEAERVANYRAIVSVLTDLGLHCCDVAGKGDAAVETGLQGDDDLKKAAANVKKGAKP
ncbi:MAG: DUF4157 domain-containing protein [Pyrinomonadaceae bacterium]